MKALAFLLSIITGALLFLVLNFYAFAANGLVASYSFNENSGSTVADSSGNGNNGSLANTAWDANGKFGSALSFNGSNSMVTVADSNSLDLTGGMTLEAWVKPTTLTSWRTIILKEKPSLAYALYANTGPNNKPSAEMYGTSALTGPAQLPVNVWSHVSATYDGTTLNLYINGTLVSSKATTITIPVSSNPLRIGGNTIWGEYFNGLIDEVRIYNRALLPSEIQSDMNSGI